MIEDLAARVRSEGIANQRDWARLHQHLGFVTPCDYRQTIDLRSSCTATPSSSILVCRPAASALHHLGEKGFVIGPQGMASELELAHTIAYELDRVNMTEMPTLGVDAVRAAGATASASDFAATFGPIIAGFGGLIRMSSYSELAQRWVEATKRVAAGTWDGIRCPANDDADIVVEMRTLQPPTPESEPMYEYRLHCPLCASGIFVHARVEYTPKPYQEPLLQ